MANVQERPHPCGTTSEMKSLLSSPSSCQDTLAVLGIVALPANMKQRADGASVLPQLVVAEVILLLRCGGLGPSD